MAFINRNPRPSSSPPQTEEEKSAFKKKAVAIVLVGLVVWGSLEFLPERKPSEQASEPVAEDQGSPPVDSSAVYQSLLDLEDQSSVSEPLIDGSVADASSPTPPPETLDQPEPTRPADKDPAAARLLLHPECHRYRYVLNETYRDPDPWALARRKVAMDILTDVGCFDSSAVRPRLKLEHPDQRLLAAGRGTSEQYSAVVAANATESCRTWANVLAQMASSPSATEQDIAEYFSRTKASRCPTNTTTGYRGFGAARWDTTSLPVSGYPPMAIASIRLVRANPRCVDFVHSLSETAETGSQGNLAEALSITLQSAHQVGCLYP